MSRTENTGAGTVVGPAGARAAGVVGAGVVGGALVTTTVVATTVDVGAVDGGAVDGGLGVVGAASLAAAKSAGRDEIALPRDPGAKISPSQATPAAIDPSRTACVAFST